ncbi:MAG: DUF4380 domain-containing protein [Candidatus Hinthialibacter antarcticus]|nr:DUF4380 domain-containing protein [Candidatus Hinthialibacter antarcticus]
MQRNNKTWTLRCLALFILCGTMAITTMNVGAGAVKIEKTTFEGWNDCYRMSNGEVELIAVADIGPRILRVGFVGGQNFFSVSEGSKGKTGGNEWNGYGGHRFWIAPEMDYTYHPDNFPVKAEVQGNSITFTSSPELVDFSNRAAMDNDELYEKVNDPAFKSKLTVQKVMKVTMSEEGEVTVDHTATNVGTQTLDISPWVLTVMSKEGLAIIPNEPYAPHGPGHFLPERQLVLWSYTFMNDYRIQFGDRYFTVQQDPKATKPFKLGFSDTQGWAGYSLNGELFVKYMDRIPGKSYPDMGSSVELFTNNAIMEIESLGPEFNLKPGEGMSHQERWRLFKTGPIERNDDAIDAKLKPLGLVE